MSYIWRMGLILVGCTVVTLFFGALAGKTWTYADSPVMHFSEEDARRFDDALPPMEKRWMPSQEEFYIMSHASLE